MAPKVFIPDQVDFLSEFDPFRSDAAGAITSTASAAAPDVSLGEHGTTADASWPFDGSDRSSSGS